MAVPKTSSVPPPLAVNPLPVVVVMASVPPKMMFAPLFVVSATAVFVVVFRVWLPLKTIRPAELLLTSMPVPLSVMVAPTVMLLAPERF